MEPVFSAIDSSITMQAVAVPVPRSCFTRHTDLALEGSSLLPEQPRKVKRPAVGR